MFYETGYAHSGGGDGEDIKKKPHLKYKEKIKVMMSRAQCWLPHPLLLLIWNQKKNTHHFVAIILNRFLNLY